MKRLLFFILTLWSGAGLGAAQGKDQAGVWNSLPNPGRQWVGQTGPISRPQPSAPWDPRPGITKRTKQPWNPQPQEPPSAPPPQETAMERTEDPRAPLPAAPGPRPVEQTEPHAGPAAAPDRPPRSGLKALAVSGNLSFIKGNIAIQDEQGTYYIFGLEKLIGFVEGLVEGATVSLEGVAAAVPPEPNAWYFYASKLKIKGREYAGLNAYYPASPPPSILQR